MIKLSTVKTEYITDNKTFVKCILKTELTDNKEKDKVTPMPLPPFIGIAKLHKEDKFDYQIGCRIALAKAERIAYKRISKILAKEYKNLSDLINDLDNFIFKAESMVKHNTEYIKNIAKN